MEEKLLEILRRVFNTQQVTISIDQSNCDKWDSLHHLSLIAELEEEFNVEFEPEEIAEMMSFEKIRNTIASKLI